VLAALALAEAEATALKAELMAMLELDFGVATQAGRRRGSRLRPGEGRFGAAGPSIPGQGASLSTHKGRSPKVAVQAKPPAGQGPVWAPCGTCHWQCGARRKLKLTRGWSPRSLRLLAFSRCS
jgi:hypothetical protein